MNAVKTMLSTVVMLSVFCSLTAFSKEVARTDRYTLMSIEALSDQAKPLSTITNVSLAKEVSSVGDGIHELLKGSGYRWEYNHPDNQLLNDLPLPAIARNIGPIRLRDALQTLAGEAWVLQADHLHRVVWFELSKSIVSNTKH